LHACWGNKEYKGTPKKMRFAENQLLLPFSSYIALFNPKAMKNKIGLFISAAILGPLLFLPSCNNIRELAAFDVIYPLPPTSFTYIPSSAKAGGAVLLFSDAIEANLDSILEANGFSAGIVGNTQFIECTVSIAQPSTLTFGWLTSASGEISSNAGFSPTFEVGSVVNTDPNATTVVLLVNNTNIRPFLGAKFFYFRVFGELNGPVPAEFVDLVVEGKLLMHLEPLN